MTGTKKAIFLSGFCIVVVSSPCPSSADMAPPIVFNDVEQDEQDVRLVLEASDRADDKADPRRIIRDVEGARTTIAEFVLTQETPLEIIPECGDYYGSYWSTTDVTVNTDEFCAQYPEACHHCGSDDDTCIGANCDDCIDIYDYGYFWPGDLPIAGEFCDLYPAYSVDCNGDEIAECCLLCGSTSLYEFRDSCVPPGPTTYLLNAYSDQAGEWTGVDWRAMDIADAGVDCEPLPPDEPEDTEQEPDATDSDNEETPIDTEDTGEATDSIDSETETADSIDTADTDVTTDSVDSETETTGDTEQFVDTENVSEDSDSADSPENQAYEETDSSDSRCSAASVGQNRLSGMSLSLMRLLLFL